MNRLLRLVSRRQVSEPGWGMLEFGHEAAEALSVVTLMASGRATDAALAGRVLEELLAAPEGAQRVARGLASVSGGLLALVEFFGAIPPSCALQELGRAIAEATAGDPHASRL